MSHAASPRDAIVAFCREIGPDPLLVQGAGGNVSWKEDGTLWVKASGTWLAEAGERDIFVPVDLEHLRDAMAAGDFSVTPRVRGEAQLRPSIETLLHALLPHRFVVHLHAVEVLARLVRADARPELAALLPDDGSWTTVPYHKPGAPLAEAIADAMRGRPGTRTVFMLNHGLVLGSDDLGELQATLTALCGRLRIAPETFEDSDSAPPAIAGYTPVADPALHGLARDPRQLELLRSGWALYPDHVVFLGAEAKVYESPQTLAASGDDGALAFVEGAGTYTRGDFGLAKLVQLRLYQDVVRRQPRGTRLHTLSNPEIGELLNWDAEQYRMRQAKQ